ncbi:hypothetical protein FRB94_004753 [Tulasnella sp. JGI-2019a]|nr:hypothetical protein FRB93_011409 [Tulasnella sp. JGI-2019a]KAG9012943.1 hypothetical protein FRB94_004753 [Tulasnella sp. JGI-2019a]
MLEFQQAHHHAIPLSIISRTHLPLASMGVQEKVRVAQNSTIAQLKSLSTIPSPFTSSSSALPGSIQHSASDGILDVAAQQAADKAHQVEDEKTVNNELGCYLVLL